MVRILHVGRIVYVLLKWITEDLSPHDILEELILMVSLWLMCSKENVQIIHGAHFAAVDKEIRHSWRIPPRNRTDLYTTDEHKVSGIDLILTAKE